MPSSHPNRVRFYRWLCCCAALLAGQFMDSSIQAADPVIDAARAKLYTSRQESIFLLEEAVLQSPQRVDYWIELLRALETDSASPFVLHCYAQAGLTANPAALDLRWEWIRLMPAPAAIDELENLGPVEKDAQRISDAIEVLRLGMKLPRDWNEVGFRVQWAVRLLRLNAWNRADKVVAAGLQLHPEDKTLQICRALVLVQQEKFDEAVAMIEALGGYQTLEPIGLGKYPNVSDLLLAKKQPRLAVRLYGTHPDEKLLTERDGLILGQALLESGDVGRAEQVFEKTDKFGAHLLVIANLLELKKEDDARAVAEELMSQWSPSSNEGRQGPGQRTSPLVNATEWPLSLQPPLERAVKWLYATYPKRQALLRANVTESPFSTKYTVRVVRSWTKMRQDLQEVNYSANSMAAQAESFSGDFALAAKLYREFLLQPKPPMLAEGEKSPPHHLGEIWNHVHLESSYGWRLNQLRVESAEYYKTRPAELIAARQLLTNLKATHWNYPPIKGQPWLNNDEVVARAVKIGKPLLPFVIAGLEPRTISGQDRTPWIKIIAQLGSAADLPALLTTLKTLDQHSIVHLPKGKQEKLLLLNDATTAEALNATLVQLTGTKCPKESTEDRIAFWEDWWSKNFAEIVKGK